jgi:hypothetical protein
MPEKANAEVGCVFIGEYVDEAGLPPSAVCSQGKVVRPRLLADFVDICGQDGQPLLDTQSLKDGAENGRQKDDAKTTEASE